MAEFDYINVPVPKHLVPDVMSFLAMRMVANVSKDNVKPYEQTLSDLIPRIWSESAKVMRQVLTYLAHHPGKAVAAPDVAQEIYGDSKGHRLAGAMGAFGRRCQNRYAGAKPFESRWNSEVSRWEYVMASDIAKLIVQVSKKGESK